MTEACVVYVRQMMEAGALDLLLLAMSTHPGSSRVQGSVVGAVLALALGNKTNMLRMETEGALRAVRASMFAYPNMSFAGFYKVGRRARAPQPVDSA